ncbi:hypothetical protein INT48_004204 [Thamnidium elegans]|uniref:Uncharacterized protein n=1 Tax=Thamnidium elegans TaxID=101142 RepID=A0A8H7VVP2_9FUNG|nr:hypothetical protein INT48_004204 [Thamnidium elegans]
MPLKTGVYLITIIGLINKLSGFYGLISLDYSEPVVVCIHVYSLLALGIFSAGLYGIHNDKYSFIRSFALFYWGDFVISTMTTIYLAIQWFLYTDHSLPELAGKLEETQQHDDTFRAESIVSIVFLGLIRVTHFYFAIVLTQYYYSLGKTQYSKVAAAIDEELNVAYDEDEEYDDKRQ